MQIKTTFFTSLLIVIATVAQAATVVASREANMVGSATYALSGTAYLEELSDGTFQFRLGADYSTDAGPDVQLLLTNHASWTSPVDTTGTQFVVDVGNDGGGISHFSGAHTTDLGNQISSLTQFDHVVFVCVRFGRLYWGHGSFGSVQQNCTPQTVNIQATLGTPTVLGPDVPGDSYQWLDCGNQKAEVTGETNMIFTPSTPGSYAVVVSNGACKDTSNCFDVISTNVGQIQSEEISFFPNPSNGKIQILADNVELVELFDINGKLIQTYNSVNHLDLSGHLPGSYWIVIKTSSDQVSKKLVLF